jgi:hypothetical protein
VRGIGFGGAVYGVVSNGALRWTFDSESYSIAAYTEVNVVDREAVTRSTAELTHHWQAWQKRARHAIERAIGSSAKIRPLFVWDPAKITMFHAGGLQLPSRLETELYSRIPELRKTIDWLRVGTGRYR